MCVGDLLYEEYLKEFPPVSQGKRKNNQISKERFKLIADNTGKDFVASNYKNKEEARKALRKNARKSMGVIEFFLLKVIVSWIIEKILSYYFL